MKRILTLATLAALSAYSALMGFAHAADLPVKAPPSILAGYPAGNGFYGGIGAVAEASNSSVAGVNGSANVISAGAGLNITAGYQWALPGNTASTPSWVALEGDFTYTPSMLGGQALCSPGNICSVNTQFSFEQRLLWGFPITQALSVLPNFGNFFPTFSPLPAGVTGTSHPYIGALLREKDVSASYMLANGTAWQVQPGLIIGVRQQWTNGLVWDTSMGCTLGGTGLSFGEPGTKATLGSDCRGAVRLLY